MNQANKHMKISSTEDILDDFRQGKMVILVDDDDRENEGDLLIASERISAEAINFMAKHGRGLICMTMDGDRCDQLNLPLMQRNNNERFSTAFTLTIEAAEGVTTGISAADRAATVKAAIKKDATPADVVTPGHIFPIRAQSGGVLTRAGHTEAGSDLARLAEFEPSSVICEVMKDDGEMARLPDLLEFGAEHNIKVGTIEDLIRYRLEKEPTVQRIGQKRMSGRFGEFRVVSYHDVSGQNNHVAIVIGEVEDQETVDVRVQANRGLQDYVHHLGDSNRWTFEDSIEHMHQHNGGVVVLLQYDNQDEELLSALHASQANRENDDVGDLRLVGIGSQILADLGLHRIRVLGSSVSTHGLAGFGLEISEFLQPKA